MSCKASKNVMKCVGATLALCSAIAVLGGCKVTPSSSAKKSMKKTINKLSDIVDMISDMF